MVLDAAVVRPVDLVADGHAWRTGDEEPPAWREMNADLGWMLYDFDFSDRASPKPKFFRANVKRGVLDLAGVEMRG